MEADLYSIVLTLVPDRKTAVRATMGHQAHAAFLRTVKEADPRLADALHIPNLPLRPFTVSGLFGLEAARDGLVQLSPERSYALRFTILSPLLFQRFMERFLNSDRRPAIRLGEASLLICEILVTPGSHPWAGYTSWVALATEAYPVTEVSLDFVSPTAFGFGQKAWGKKIVVLPQPELVFGSLLRSWNSLAPPPLQIDAQFLKVYLEEHVVVKRLRRLETCMLDYGCARQVGFTGQVSFGLMGNNEAARCQIDALAHFAFYAGVGVKTGMGMGQVRRIAT